jgi:hypothetical protein
MKRMATRMFTGMLAGNLLILWLVRPQCCPSTQGFG